MPVDFSPLLDQSTEDQTITLDDISPYEDTDDPLHRTHIINPPDNPHISHGFPDMTGQQVVDHARMFGLEIVALCGYKFVPKANPDKYDACEACMKVAEHIMRSQGE